MLVQCQHIVAGYDVAAKRGAEVVGLGHVVFVGLEDLTTFVLRVLREVTQKIGFESCREHVSLCGEREDTLQILANILIHFLNN